MQTFSGRVFPGLAISLLLAVTTGLHAGDTQRIPWTESRLTGTAEPPLPWRVTRCYEKLPLKAPVYLRAEPGTRRILYVDHKAEGTEPGGLRAFQDDADSIESEPILTMDNLIYGFCFHPNYDENGYLFVISNGPQKESSKKNRISRFTISRDGTGRVLSDSELVILEWESNGHNGGDLGFGPDGFLYCPTGDGTTDSDPLQTGQGLNDLLAVMLRLDVDHPGTDKPYSIPADNPFQDTPGARPEIWAYGFRNPWRMDFDRKTGQLWLGQNGQDLWEQVYLVRRGENYGWSIQEGSHPFYTERPRGAEPVTNPVAEHHHSESRSLTGGIVYRGVRHPELDGCFIYGDYSTGKIWGIRHDGMQVTFHRELADTTLQIAGFGISHAGDVLVVDHGGGIYRLEPNPPAPEMVFPRKLSETGLFESVAAHQMKPGIMPYKVNVPFWSDGAAKHRWIALPGNETISYTSSRGWNFPNGAVLVKSFTLERQPGNTASRFWIETRLMVRLQNEWSGYSYRWNKEQTDAELVGKDGWSEEVAIQDPDAATQRSQIWHFPSRAECMVCHSRAANYVLGVCEPQMNRVHDYGDGQENQLERLSRMGYFSSPLTKPVGELTKLTDPFDENADLQLRALSWIHANCAGCHIEAGGGNSQFSAEISASLEQQQLIDVKPVHNSFQISDARLVAPGHPDQSVLLYRISHRGQGQMPPLSSTLPDRRGAELIRRWIQELKPRPE